MIRVVVVDDSAVARRLIVHILSAAPDIAVVGEAVDGRGAVSMVDALRPDVVTMDIQMPVMNGYDAARQIMVATPTPIIIVSAHEAAEMHGSFRAIDAGAVTVLAKPGVSGVAAGDDLAADLVATVRAMAGLQVVRRRPQSSSVPAPRRPGARRGRIDLIAIGASTGGPAVIATILRGLKEPLPVPMLLVQHIAEGFDEGLVDWLDSVSPIEVRLGYEGQRPSAGQLVVAPNGLHMGISDAGVIALSEGAPIEGHRPSATHLFASVARAVGERAVGVILTGIGRDGTDGLSLVHAAGGHVIAQDEATSVVFGMPKSAIDVGAVEEVLAADDIAASLAAMCDVGRESAESTG